MTTAAFALVLLACNSKQKSLDELFAEQTNLVRYRADLSKIKLDQQGYIMKSMGQDVDYTHKVVFGEKIPEGKKFEITKEKKDSMFRQMQDAEEKVAHSKHIIDSITLITR